MIMVYLHILLIWSNDMCFDSNLAIDNNIGNMRSNLCMVIIDDNDTYMSPSLSSTIDDDIGNMSFYSCPANDYNDDDTIKFHFKYNMVGLIYEIIVWIDSWLWHGDR